MSEHDDFLRAINEKKLVLIECNSYEKGYIQRKCVPFDYGPSRRYKDSSDRYHFYDLDSPDGSHNLSILPEQLLFLKILDEQFEPKDYINWVPNWFIPRDWGKYS